MQGYTIISYHKTVVYFTPYLRIGTKSLIIDLLYILFPNKTIRGRHFLVWKRFILVFDRTVANMLHSRFVVFCAIALCYTALENTHTDTHRQSYYDHLSLDNNNHLLSGDDVNSYQ